MNINKMKYVQAVAEYKNLSQAAKSLYISQPALTKSLNLLEEELNVKLFDRNASPIQLTYGGNVFLEKANRIIELHDSLMKDMRSIALSEKGQLTLAISGERGSMWLPYLIPWFERDYPNVDLKIIEANSSQTEAGILSGEIDLAIFSLPVYSSDIDFEVIYDDPFVIATNRYEEFASRFDLSRNSLSTPYLIPPSMLEGEKLITVTKGNGVRRMTNYLFEYHGIKQEVHRELARHETAVKLAAYGTGYTFTSTTTPKRLGLTEQMAFFSLDNPPLSRKIIVGYHKDKGVSQMGQNLINLIHKAFRIIPTLMHTEIRVIPPIYPKSSTIH